LALSCTVFTLLRCLSPDHVGVQKSPENEPDSIEHRSKHGANTLNINKPRHIQYHVDLIFIVIGAAIV
jgi:hypothetical protein